MSKARITIDHDTIRQWAEDRGGSPASVDGTAEGDEPGILRLDFRPKDEGLHGVDWDAFFEKFEEANLAFLYQEQTADGRVSRFHKFIDRDAAGDRDDA